jgi:nucleotide-binding universal stress UspA family protein/predicted phosphoribosyltransferase
MAIGRILVPIDFSDTSLRACDFAIALAEPLDAAIHLLEVLEPAPFFSARTITEATRDGARAALAKAVAEIRPWARVGSSVAVGTPWIEIAREAADAHADLVVMGTQGRRGVGRAALGSVAAHVVRGSPVPVLTVPRCIFETRAEAAPRLAAKLAPLGFGPASFVALSREALPLAAALAKTLGGHVDLWMTAAVTHHAARIGTVGEDGRVALDAAASAVSPDDLAVAEEVAKRHLHGEMAKLLEWRTPRALHDGSVVFVADSVVAPSAVRIAADAVRPRGSRRVALATPILSRVARHAAEDAVDAVVHVEEIVLSHRASFYRDARPVSEAQAHALLHA